MAEQHLVYHWKHGWIPLTHAAALSKAHGNSKLADRYVGGASLHHASRETHGKSARQIHGGLENHARIMARPTVYRGESGHHISGTDTRGRHVSVFVPGERADAQRAIDNIHAGRPAFAGQTPQAVEPSASTARASVEHSGDGTLLSIDRNDAEARAAAKAAGFKWSSNLGSWFLPRNWSESTRRQKVAQFRTSLGTGNVHLKDGGRGVTTTAAEREAEQRARAVDRAQRMDERAQRAATEADVRFGRAHAIGDMIPMGQPILVGHHSEGRHRRDLARIDTNMRKGVEAHQKAGEVANAAENARRTAEGVTPLARQRRIDRNEAELRAIDRQLTMHSIAQKAPEKAARVGIHPLTPEDHAGLTASRARLVDEIAHDKAQIAASGHVAIKPADLTPGDVVYYRGSPHIVKKVNKTTVSVPTGYSWDDKAPINQLTKHVKLVDIPTPSLESAVKNETDPKIRQRFIAELNRRGIKVSDL